MKPMGRCLGAYMVMPASVMPYDDTIFCASRDASRRSDTEYVEGPSSSKTCNAATHDRSCSAGGLARLHLQVSQVELHVFLLDKGIFAGRLGRGQRIALSADSR
jgi:hypothetical protein